MDAGRARHLRQEHRAEFTGADQAYADRFAGGGECVELMEQVGHGCLSPCLLLM